MIDLLIGFWPKIAAFAAFCVAVIVGLLKIRKSGSDAARREMRERDYERARNIRDRVERDLPDIMREYEGRGFRD